MITAQELREVLSYDPESGAFRWIGRVNNRMPENAIAGTMMNSGYVRIKVSGRYVVAHQLAWLYVTGEWPTSNIDHVNGDRADNRIANLRLATRHENARNRKRHKNNSLGLKGVSLDKETGRFKASIWIDGGIKNLGRFNCPTAAHLAYCKAARKHFGDFAREK